MLDWTIVAFALLLAWFGYKQGFIIGVLSFVGFCAGAFAGTRIAPSLLPDGASSPYAPAFGLLGALLAGVVLATGLEGIGMRLRRVLSLPGVRAVDGGLGALLSATVALGVVWIVAAVAAQVPGEYALRAAIQQSVILRTLNKALPPSGPVLGALARLDPLPSISGPTPDVPPPSARIDTAPEVSLSGHSVVRVIGTACGLAIEGSGWVVAPGEILTNAHVVAGETDTTIQRYDELRMLRATAVAFDPTDDLAVLRVEGLDLPALRLAKAPKEGTAGAILGYPENGPFDVEPARIGRTQRVLSDNAYGEGPVTRELTPLRGLVRPGNSGGPVVDRAGAVLTTVFASTTSGGEPGGYGVSNATVAKVVSKVRGPVSTGTCAGG